MSSSRRQEVLDTLRRALVDNLDRYLPGEGYRDYYRWALSECNPDRRLWERVIALHQLATMTTAVLGDLGNGWEWSVLLRYSIPVNVYQVFEVVSDNLALGLADPATIRSPRRKLLRRFNDIIAADLHGCFPHDPASLLADLRVPAAGLSASGHSLAPEVHTALARRYSAVSGGVAPEWQRDAVWCGLVANLSAVRDVLTAISGTRTAGLIRTTTADRYWAVNRLLTEPAIPRAQRTELGRRTILVTPTLAYVAAVLGEILTTDHGYLDAVEDGTLLATVEYAAVLVRLTNDIGTPLLRMRPQQQTTLLRDLPRRYPPTDRDNTTDTIVALLRRASGSEPTLNRFRKDLTMGEYNLCLDELHPITELDHGLVVLEDSLRYFSSLYTQHRYRLAAALALLEEHAVDRRIIMVIRRFVDFHDSMYARSYDAGAGDYAI